MAERGITLVIVPNGKRTTQWETDFTFHRKLNLINWLFNKIKLFMAVATHYD